MNAYSPKQRASTTPTKTKPVSRETVSGMMLTYRQPIRDIVST
jgi:hypothetical protein